jgi:hypothetical protein
MQTLNNFQTILDRLTFHLRPIRNDGFLNEEGIRTLEACDRLSEMVEFHNNLKEYLEDETVKEIFRMYNDCRKIKKAEDFLKKQI